jgi:hypothetical protein
MVISLVECFLIQNRTREYNEHIEKEVLKNMNIVFGESLTS